MIELTELGNYNFSVIICDKSYTGEFEVTLTDDGPEINIISLLDESNIECITLMSPVFLFQLEEDIENLGDKYQWTSDATISSIG